MTTPADQYGKKYTNVFLMDNDTPHNIVLLKRSPDKRYAPNMYTGIGGKIEADESAETAAYRELQEETGVTGLSLTEFARCIIPTYQGAVYYYQALYTDKTLPTCNEGVLEWVSADALMSRRIIPGTAFVLAEWRKRGLRADRPFTLFLNITGAADNWNSGRSVDHIAEGLLRN